ncbi:MAG: enoyl-CoA hydratase/isomerase family protein [Myxococcota bacterium]
MPDPVLYEVRDRVATITLNRPEQRNALSPDALAGLRRAVERADGDVEVRAVILTGAGERAFSAGADLGGGASGSFADPRSFEMYESRRAFPELFQAMHEARCPIIGKVRGYCLAGGLGLALACDLLVAGESAVFGTPEVRVGLFPMMIFAEIVRNVGLKHAMELVLVGERIGAERAQQIGLVNRVVPEAELDAEVDSLAQRLARHSPVVVGLGKRAAYTAADMTYRQALEFLRGQLSLNLLTEDAEEGLRAFRERREPEFRGR